MTLEKNLDNILHGYQSSFSNKVYNNENNDSDLLMAAFGISPELKRENKQYWGRELGKCWESLVIEVCKNIPTFQPALRINADEPCDLIVENYAIDTKYRVGSGDSGTLKKFKQYGATLKNLGYTPVFLFLREDNLPAAMTACQNGGWSIYIADQSFDFIQEISGFDMKTYLTMRSLQFSVNR
ncbi:MAG: hypothetical protein QS748_09905 [Candidatus Endonucleobacter bathymodioli]|uniref:Restriction endonuclease n=1 Tax=Candidatus Endonucleibacter bathymodioli TaxID=539814 RepID=A0AA90SN16_9GAMM|nr:hypothetical protein [Candidatus Endonucleobacter bathymodioli]